MSIIKTKVSETSAIDFNSADNATGTNWAVNTYTGQWELNDYAYAGVNLVTNDDGGTLFLDFSQDGVAFSSYPVAGFTVVQNINEVHTAWKGGRYFRVRYVGTGGTRTEFNLKTFYSNHSLPLSAPLNQSIGTDQDATVVRSVSIGEDPAGSYTNQKVDGQGYITTTPLAVSGQYDAGVLDLQGYTQVQTHIVSDVDGTITVEFCSDSGGTVVRTLTIPYFAADGFQMFSAPAFTPYVRYKYDNGGTIQTSFFFETKFLTKPLSGQLLGLDSFIAPSMVANLGRNVIVGRDPAGTFRNVPTDTEGHLKVNVNDPVTAFGDLRIAELTPQIQLTFPYNINPDLVSTVTANSGAVTVESSMAKLSTGVTAASEAELASRDVVKYRSGLGTLARFTGMFSTNGGAGTAQHIGIGDAEDGFFFGYQAGVFGIIIRKDTIDEFIAQTIWNVDLMDGLNGSNNPSNMLLDHDTLNVYQIHFQWLGAGQIEFGIENPATGGFVPVHRVEYANNNVVPSIYNPSLTLSARVDNAATTDDLTIHTASMAGFTEGKNIVTGPVNTTVATGASITTEIEIVAIRNNATYASKTNKTRVKLKGLSCGLDGTKIGQVRIYLAEAADLTGGTFTDLDANRSVISVNNTLTGSTPATAKLLFDGILAPGGGATFDFENLNYILAPGDHLLITGEAAGAADITAAIIWQEDF